MKNSHKYHFLGADFPGFLSCLSKPSLRNLGLLSLAVTIMLLSGTAHAQWLTGYQYRKSLAINAGVAVGTSYQIQVKVGESSGAVGYNIHAGGNAMNFPNDIRFTDDDGTTELGHWLESTTGNTPNRTATFWVKVNDNLDSTQSIKAYYAKSAGTSASSGDATFNFFDDFSGGAIDGAKWIIDNATGWSVTGGELRGQNTSGRIRSQLTFNSGVILETKYRPVSRPGNGHMPLGFYTNTADNFGWLNHPGGDYMRVNGTWTGIGNECNVPVVARITARTTQVDLYVYRQDNGAVWHNRTNNTSTVSNERITLGTRYDNSYPSQTYDAYWDMVRVRKYATTDPTLGASGNEESLAPLVTLTTPTNGMQVVSGSSATATATVTAGTPPYTVQFHLNSSPVGSPITSPPYTYNLGVLTDGAYTIQATVSDSTTPTPATASSATHNFTVAPDSSPPTPNPMTFVVEPLAVSESSIRMVATTATDTASPSVEYYFENITNATNSGWISSPIWTESGLTLGVSYGYRVKARDSASPTANETGFSTTSYASPATPPGIPITIVNPGFENPPLADNSSIGTFQGWTRMGGAFAWNPPTTSYPQEAPEGQNIGTIFLSSAFSGCSQILQGAEGQFQANTSYELKVKVGGGASFAGTSYAYDGYLIQLLVNGTIIAQDDNSNVPANGSFTTTSLKYNYNAALHSGLVGYPIEIRLLTKGFGAGSGIVSFDDLSLTYSTSNLVAIHGGPYRLNEGSPLSLNGSFSIPSSGASITSYEWDLDNGNDQLGFIADLVGATPSSISYATLTSTYGMESGANNIRLRITDSTGQSNIGTTTVTIYRLFTYIGPASPSGNNENWNKTANWNTAAIPSGLVNVYIPPSKFIPCLSAVTPIFTGDMTIGSNSQLSLGWTTSGPSVANCMGTPGSTVITMDSGSSINIRIGGFMYIPAIILNGNASVTLGSSTQQGANTTFNYPITGSYRMSFYGNSTGSCIANMNATNTFNEIYTIGGPYVDGGVTIVGNAPGSLGTGNLNLNALTGGGNSGILIINAENSMSDNAVLTMNGNSATKITMNANDTISSLVINGAQMPAGTYGSSSSSATFKQTWISGSAILTVTEGQGTYWDINGVTAGAGGATPSGNWDSSSTLWSASPTGEAATASWSPGKTAVFAAGTSATGSYTVNVGDSNAITLTNSFTASSNTGTSSFNVTRSGWALNGGNCVAVIVSAINATGFTATYAGQAMTVQGVYEARNSYVGIAYIISDALPATGDVVISVPRVVPAINTGGYANMGTVYSIMSLSNVASAGTATTQVHTSAPPTTNLTYSTSINNSYVLGAASDSNWQNVLKTVVGTCNQVISNAKPGYYNTIHCRGSVSSAGSYTDTYGASPAALITRPFNAKSTPNPLLTGGGQKISGLKFEEGAVTVSGSKLELQTTSSFTSNTGITGTISSQISGVSTSGITKKGPGTIVLSNSSNNYTGATTIQNGILRLGNANAIPNTAVSINSDAGVTATLELNGYNATVASLSFGGSSSTSGSSITTGSGILTLGGNLSFNSANSPQGATLTGNLALSSPSSIFDIKDTSTATNDLTISAIVSGTGGFNKQGFGTLLLSANNTYTGTTSVSSGLLVLSGSNNSAATGGITVNQSGSVRFDALGAINGTGQNVTIQSGGLVYFGSSFGGANIPAALARINPASSGVIAVDNFFSSNFDFTANSLNTYLGSISDITYSGTITPYGGAYRLGGGGGTITLTGAGALQSGNNLIINGRVTLANSYNLGSGSTTINPSGRLQLGTGGTLGSLASTSLTNNGALAFNRSNTLTQGTDFWASISGSGVIEKLGSGTLILNAANTHSGGTNLLSGTLLLSHPTALGTGLLGIYSGVLDASTDLTLSPTPNNAIVLLGDFSFGGTANLNMGTGSVGITGDHIITLNGSNKSLTFGGVVSNISGGDQILTVDGADNTLVLGGYNMSSDIYSYLMDIEMGGTGNITITGTINDWSDVNIPDIRLGALTKTGSGTLTLSGVNNYTGNTIVTNGVLHLLNSSVSPPSQVSPIIVNNGGILAFTLGTTVTSGESLRLNDGHKIRIVGTPTLSSYTLMTASSIVGGSPTLETPIPGYFLEIAGKNLKLTQADTTPPELVDITNNQGFGATVGPIVPNTLVTYTVTFNEDIDHESVTAADFDNAGSIPIGNISFGTIMEITPGVFTLEVTPTTAGTLKLRIPTTAVINDKAVIPNALDDDPAIDDDTTINVASPSNNWLLSTDIVDDKEGTDIGINSLVTYTLYFDRDIDHTTVTSIDFDNAGTASFTIGTITETAAGIFTVQVTPTSLGTLQLSIPTSAIIEDPSDNILDNDPAIVDDTTIGVITKFDSWAGTGNIFGDDLNTDGIANGLAWLLGANNPNVDARDLLPLADQTAGDLTLIFNTLNTAGRGTASIKVQYSNDLGITDLWENNEAEVPGAPGIPTDPGYTVNGIKFTISDAGNGLLYVEATIDDAEAGVGKKLFARVRGTAP